MQNDSPLARAFRLTKSDPVYGGTPGAKNYPEQGDALRYVGRVVPESDRDWLDTHDLGGWQTDPYGDVFRDGSGLCYGVVYQLPSRKGVARFVAGYGFGGVDGGPTLDLETVYTIEDETEQDAAAYYSGATAAADSMAKAAGEKERDYQTAWQAGRRYAEAAQEVKCAQERMAELIAGDHGSLNFYPNADAQKAFCEGAGLDEFPA